METMLISDFKAKAIATLKRVQASGEPLLVTLRGEPLAEVLPARTPKNRGIQIGAGCGLLKKHLSDSDLASQIFPDEWEINS